MWYNGIFILRRDPVSCKTLFLADRSGVSKYLYLKYIPEWADYDIFPCAYFMLGIGVDKNTVAEVDNVDESGPWSI